MKKRLNEQLSIQSALLIVVSAVLFNLMFATFAKACSPFKAAGCDVNCTVQILNDCQSPNVFQCVARTCDRLCDRPTCNPPRCIERPCMACVDRSLGGCAGLPECCSGVGFC